MAWGIVVNQMFRLIAFYCRSTTQGNLQLEIKNLHQIYLLSSGENPGAIQLIDGVGSVNSGHMISSHSGRSIIIR